MQKRYIKWQNWLTIIEKEVTDLHRYHHIYREVRKIVNNNPDIQKPSSFYEFLSKAYVALIVMGIRRQIKIDTQSISFARLLKEIIETPEIITRERFVKMYKGSFVRRLADADFDQFSGIGGRHVKSGIIRKDLENLLRDGNKFEDYADRKLAHRDKREPAKIPTYSETKTFIDTLGKLLKKYVLLFRAEGLISVLPTYQYDWKIIFKEPWIKSH